MYRPFGVDSVTLGIWTTHVEGPAGERDEDDSRLSVAVLGVALDVPPKALEVTPEKVPGSQFRPVLEGEE